ncbi:MAG: DUF1638 domain-containing protein [Desulfitobacteriaceae bacterium]|nr:DUF1638 domain-containing protein [Desulfitobacteriaceae bacterium]
MRIKMIGCASIMNEIRWIGIPENTDCEFLDFNFHANPIKLHEKLQQAIDESQDYDLIILANSRCSNILINLVSPKVPLLFPRTHDCIGLLLGSNKRHLELLQKDSAVYYFSQGWLDYGRSPYAEFLEYEQKYGRETAKSLIDTLYGRYQKAMFIVTPGIKNIQQYREQVEEIARFFNWETTETNGDLDLLSSLVNGIEKKDIIRIEPGVKITEELLEKYN